MPITHDDVYQAADELKSIGTMGLRYTLSDYDTDRYQRTLNRSWKIVPSS
jgi:Hydrolase of X-linked nucleoside diphosphate N terminal